MKRCLALFALGLGLLVAACGNQTNKSLAEVQPAALDLASFAFAQEQLPSDMSNVKDDGKAISGDFSFMDYLFALDLTIGDDCNLDGKILVYQGEALADELTVVDNIVHSQKNPQYVGKISYSRKACAKPPTVLPIKEDSCHGACAAAAGLFCKIDVDKLAETSNLIAACKTAGNDQCYKVAAEPMCQEVYAFYF